MAAQVADVAEPKASEEEFVTWRCATCGGVAHPASGCQYTERFIVCGPCTRLAWVWLRKHINGKGARKGLLFYEYAGRREDRHGPR